MSAATYGRDVWLAAILFMTLGRGELYGEACRLLREGHLSQGAEALLALPPSDPYRRKADVLLPVLHVLQGKRDYTGPFAAGRLAQNRLELGVSPQGSFTAGLLGGEGFQEAYVPFLFGFPVPFSSRWTIWIDGEPRPLPLNGQVNAASARWRIEGVEFLLSLSPAVMGKGPPSAARIAMEVRNTSPNFRRIGLRLVLDMVDGFEDAPRVQASPFGWVSRSQEWMGEDVPLFFLGERTSVVLRGADLFPPDRMILCPWTLAEERLWEFPLPADLPLGSDTAAVMVWDPRPLAAGEARHAALRLGQGELGLDRSGFVASLAVVEPGPGDEMGLTLHLENSAPGILETLQDIRASVTLPPGLRLKAGEDPARELGDLPREESRQVHWILKRTGEAGGTQSVSVAIGEKNGGCKDLSVPVALPVHGDLAGRALSFNHLPLPDAEVAAFAAGREARRCRAGSTGAFRLGMLGAGVYSLQGQKLLHRQPAVKRGHEDLDQAIYDLVLDSDRVEKSGALTSVQAAVGEGRDLHLEHATFRYNLLLSVQWDADRAFLENVVRGMRAASNYLYDALDGQMCFGKVSIFDNGVHWEDADMQIFAQNDLHANANVDGYRWRWEPWAPWNTAIHFGRSWNGGAWAWSFGIFPWDDQMMYRTIVHEFGHYGLGLFDEYIGVINGIWRGLAISEMCPSFMGYQYVIGGDFNSNRDTELCFRGNHHPYTAQGVYRGMSCWEWVKRTHDGMYGGIRVSLVSPAERGCICPGPALDIGNKLQAFIHDAETGAFEATLSIAGPWAAEVWGIPVWTTVAAENRKVYQGRTGINSKIRLLGIHVGDRAEAIHEGKQAEMILAERKDEYELQFLPFPRGVSDFPVILSVLPEGVRGEEVSKLSALTVEMETPLGAQRPPTGRMRWGSIEESLSLLPSDRGTRWTCTVALHPGGQGRGSIEIQIVTASGEPLFVVTDFCTDLLRDGECECHNFDGTFSLRTVPGALAFESPVVFSSSLVPSFEEDHAALVGRIESIQGKEGPPRFRLPASLRIAIPPEVPVQDRVRITLRQWKEGKWEIVSSSLDPLGISILAQVSEGGIFGMFLKG